MIEQHKDRLTGCLGMAVSSVYIYQASLIEDSLLADAVGVAGVPTAIGYLMLAASLFLFLKSWLKTKQEAEVSEEETEAGGSKHPHLKALGLLTLLATFVAIVPVAGVCREHWVVCCCHRLLRRRSRCKNIAVVCPHYRPRAVVVF